MTIQEIKKEFFAYRNGIVADVYRKAGAPYSVIFGLQLPQLSAIASGARDKGQGTEKISELSRELWADKSCRESRLLACYLFDPQAVSVEQAAELARDCQTQEEADMLAFRLLSRMPDAEKLLKEIADTPAGRSLAGRLE